MDYTTLVHIMTGTFFALTIFIYARYGGPIDSYSAFTYVHKVGGPLLFFIFCAIEGFCIVQFGDFNILFAVSGIGFMLLGVASTFKTKNTEGYHLAGALISIAGTLLAIFLAWGIWIPTAVGIAMALILKRPWFRRVVENPFFGPTTVSKKLRFKEVNNYTFWIEFVFSMAIMVGLYRGLS